MKIVMLLERVINASISLLNGASVWLVFSFILAGFLHNILTPGRFQKMLGNKKISSVAKSTISGMLLPMCSCGVIPLGLSMYYSGVYLGPTLAFMTAAPIINPAAIILSYGLLGPQIASIYLMAGFILPMLIGILSNAMAGTEIHVRGIEQGNQQQIQLEEENKLSLREKVESGLKWAFMDLGLTVSKYVIPGMIIAGFVLSIIPHQFFQRFFGNPGIISIGGVAVAASLMYVCAVGHIPFVAALVASGAAPGVAITFLLAGTATNLPELISIYKLIGKRAVVIYSTTIVVCSFAIGYVTNMILLPDFTPFINFDRTSKSIQIANRLIVNSPNFVRYICSFIIVYLFLYATLPKAFSRK